MAAPQVTPISEFRHAGGFMVSEARGHRSRQSGTITGAALLRAGTILGQQTLGAATSAVKASGANTGNGTFVIDAVAPTQANALAGLYTLRCIEAVVNGGKFQLLDPLGRSVGTYIIVAGAGGTVTIADQIKGVLTDAATDFIVGDGFDITVPVGTLKWVVNDPTKLDGSQYAAGLLYQDTDATLADQLAAIVVRDCEYNDAEIVYGAALSTNPLKAAARAQLAALGMIGRTGL